MTKSDVTLCPVTVPLLTFAVHATGASVAIEKKLKLQAGKDAYRLLGNYESVYSVVLIAAMHHRILQSLHL